MNKRTRPRWPGPLRLFLDSSLSFSRPGEGKGGASNLLLFELLVLLDAEWQRAESRTLTTYPEWHIVHAYDDYARVITDGDPHEFGIPTPHKAVHDDQARRGMPLLLFVRRRELMKDIATGQNHTAHTTFAVPLVFHGRPARFNGAGSLRDIAPTMLALLGLEQPDAMTGRSLLDIGGAAD